jgi:hypothetical protein
MVIMQRITKNMGTQFWNGFHDHLTSQFYLWSRLKAKLEVIDNQFLRERTVAEWTEITHDRVHAIIVGR